MRRRQPLSKLRSTPACRSVTRRSTRPARRARTSNVTLKARKTNPQGLTLGQTTYPLPLRACADAPSGEPRQETSAQGRFLLFS